MAKRHFCSMSYCAAASPVSASNMRTDQSNCGGCTIAGAQRNGRWQAWNQSSTRAPEAIAVRLVIARRDLVAKLTNPEAWNSGPATAGLIGQASQAATNRHLEVFAAVIRFGHPALTTNPP